MDNNDEWRKRQQRDSDKMTIAALIGVIICLSLILILELITP